MERGKCESIARCFTEGLIEGMNRNIAGIARAMRPRVQAFSEAVSKCRMTMSPAPKRIKHLALHSKKWRIRKKNRARALKGWC